MTLRWGIIGCGDVCETKSGPALYKARGSDVSVVMRRDAAKAEDFARRHHIGRWTTDADAVIAAEDVDILYIATPPGSHRDYALQVAAAGKPCYVEKPMARSATECREMVAAFERAGQPLFVAYYRRRLPRFIKAKELLMSGAIGTLTGVSYRQATASHRHDAESWRYDAAQAGGGLLLDLGSHALDILDFLLGPLENVVGRAANLAADYAVEDAVSMVFTVTSGRVPGSAHWCFAAGASVDELELRGTDGRISLSVFGNGPVRLENRDGEQHLELPNPEHIQQPLVQTIVDQLTGEGGRCPSTGLTALRTSAVIDQVLGDYYGGRDDAFWTRPRSWYGRRR